MGESTKFFAHEGPPWKKEMNWLLQDKKGWNNTWVSRAMFQSVHPATKLFRSRMILFAYPSALSHSPKAGPWKGGSEPAHAWVWTISVLMLGRIYLSSENELVGMCFVSSSQRGNGSQCVEVPMDAHSRDEWSCDRIGVHLNLTSQFPEPRKNSITSLAHIGSQNRLSSRAIILTFFDASEAASAGPRCWATKVLKGMDSLLQNEEMFSGINSLVRTFLQSNSRT